MELRVLGHTDLKTAPIVLGGNVFGWTIDEQQSFEILDGFVERGFNTIDTADVYSKWAPGNSGGESETIIGKWLKQRGNRDSVNIITKGGYDGGDGEPNLSADHLIRSCENSLRRLQIDSIDLYLTHRDDNRTPVEETLGAYQKLIDAGKVRSIGASNLSPERLQASLDASENKGLPRYEVLQPEYNLYAREGFEKGTSVICQTNGLGVITYFALASGFLTGKYRESSDSSKSIRGPRMENYLNDRGFSILAALDEVSAAHNVTQAAVALAWLIASPIVTAPIASATKTSHLDAFTAAAGLELTPNDKKRLDDASSYDE